MHLLDLLQGLLGRFRRRRRRRGLGGRGAVAGPGLLVSGERTGWVGRTCTVTRGVRPVAGLVTDDAAQHRGGDCWRGAGRGSGAIRMTSGCGGS